MSDRGFLVVVREDVVRTAWFVDLGPNPHNVHLFEKAWTYVKKRIDGADQYLSEKDGERVRHLYAMCESQSNWIHCPDLDMSREE